MQPSTDPVDAEQHDADKPGLQKKGHQDFVGKERADDVAGAFSKNVPIRAELVGQNAPGHNAHGKAQRKELDPEAQKRAVDGSSRTEPQQVEDDDESGNSDAVGRPQDG